ncbi:MAG: thioesterase [Bacteroidetes bacterium]|nr:thioesterase [Bacteroidota bacterium]
MRLRVTAEMTARFFDCTIHPLYATFALIEHAEYASRQAILPFLEPGDDAVGAHVELEHVAPTPVGWIVEITARVIECDGRSIVCRITASNRNGVIAEGTQRQRVVSKRRLEERIAALYSEQPDA